MYFNIDCLKIINLPCTSDNHICYIKANKDRTKICILTKNGITLWLTAVCVSACISFVYTSSP